MSENIGGNQGEQPPNKNKRKGTQYNSREADLIRELVKSRLARNENLVFEDMGEYEVPPRFQFPMPKKPALTIWYGRMKFNMACIRLFEGVQYIIPSVNRKKKRIAAIMCTEEESASVEWARINKKGQWVNKDIISDDYTANIFQLMNWNKECRYKVMGQVADSDVGLILVFDLEEDGVMFEPKPQEFTDPVTGEVKKKQVKYYPDFYKGRIGKYYNDYAAARQINMFEQVSEYTTPDQS